MRSTTSSIGSGGNASRTENWNEGKWRLTRRCAAKVRITSRTQRSTNVWCFWVVTNTCYVITDWVSVVPLRHFAAAAASPRQTFQGHMICLSRRRYGDMLHTMIPIHHPPGSSIKIPRISEPIKPTEFKVVVGKGFQNVGSLETLCVALSLAKGQ